MWLLGKVTIICVAQFVMIPRAHAKPNTFLNNQAKGNNRDTLKKYLTSVQRATGERDVKNSDTNSETILKEFNPLAKTSRLRNFYFQDNKDKQSFQRSFSPDSSNIKTSVDLKPTRNGTILNFQKFKPTTHIDENKQKRPSVPKAFTSDSGFRNVGNFPEVEYPLSAKDTWKPNYWSIPSDFKDLNALTPGDAQFNQNFPKHPTRNVGINTLGKYGTFSTKSYSDITKNKEQLKEIIKYKVNNINRKKNSTLRNVLIENNEKNFTNDVQTTPVEEMVEEFHTTSIPYYFTTIHITPDCGENNIGSLNTLPIFNNTNQDISCLPQIQNGVKLKIIKTNNQFSDKNTLKENNTINSNGDQKDILEIEYDPCDILDIRRSDGSDLSGLDDDYTTDVYSEEENIGWFSQPVTTPSPLSVGTLDLTWRNCKIIAPCDYNVDELEDYYISV